MRAAPRLLALVGSVLFAAVAAAAPCRDNGVRVDVIQRGDVIELRARSERVSYYTLTLTFSAQNMSATSRSPVTVESRGRRQLSVVTLRGRDGGKAWTYDYVFSWRPGARFGQHDAGYRYALPFDAGRRFTVKPRSARGLQSRQGVLRRTSLRLADADRDRGACGPRW